MKYTRHISLSLIYAALLLLGGCAADRIDEPAGGATDDSGQFWIQFRLAQDISNPVGPAESAKTRATDTDLVKTDDEVKIKSLVGLLFDTDNSGNPKSLVGYSRAADDDIDGPTDKRTTVLLNMGLNSYYKREQKYRLYVFANIPGESDANYKALEAAKGKSFADVQKMVADIPFSYPAEDKGIALGTSLADGLKIMVWLKKGEKYDGNNPYIVQVESSDPANAGRNDAVLSLTPLQARFDFVSKTGVSDFTYPVNFVVNGVSKPEIKVKFVNYNVVIPTRQVYYFQNGKVIDNSVASPAPDDSRETSLLSSMYQSVYVPEFVPSVADDKKLKFGDVTYVALRAVPVVDASCTAPSDVKDAINSASADVKRATPLWYYDDGTFQSGLTTKSHEGESNWHAITYDPELRDYGICYYHAVRHSAGTEDNIYTQLEYGVVRNYIYKIGIESVAALPHPFDPQTVPVENVRVDVSLRINPPEEWTYHRIGNTLTFN